MSVPKGTLEIQRKRQFSKSEISGKDGVNLKQWGGECKEEIEEKENKPITYSGFWNLAQSIAFSRVGNVSKFA